MLSKWLKETEKKVKDFGLVSTLDDKQLQLKNFQVRNVCCVHTSTFEENNVLSQGKRRNDVYVQLVLCKV